MRPHRSELGYGMNTVMLLAAMVGASCGPPPEPIEPMPVGTDMPPTTGLRLPVVNVDGELFLVHPALGFRLSHPGPQFLWSEDIETRICTSMETELSVECHALSDPATGMIFTVQLNSVPSAAAADFPEFHQGLVGGLGEEMTIARQEVATDARGRPVSRILALASGQGVSVYAQTHPLIDETTGRHYAVSVFVYGADPQGISSLDISYHEP